MIFFFLICQMKQCEEEIRQILSNVDSFCFAEAAKKLKTLDKGSKHISKYD